MSLARIAGAAESSALDAAVIAAGTSARRLMRRAGAAAAARIVRRAGDRARRGVAIYTGAGNNGGDGWVVAKELARAGVPVRVSEVMPASTEDAVGAREEARRAVRIEVPRGDEAVIVDAMLGVGGRGSPRGPIASAIEEIESRRAGGAYVVSLDVPSGLDATSGGAEGALHADLTLAFATMKRGLLIARGHAGAIEVLDIGVHPSRDTALPGLADDRYLARHVTPLDASAHKGTRRKLLVVGGARGMAGAAVLAGAAALRSGIGMVRLVVAPESLTAVQSTLPEATAADWPQDDESATSLGAWADAIVIGPGFGPAARDITARMLRLTRTPVVLDADAITAWSDDRSALAALLAGRRAVMTPHPAELARFLGSSPSEVLVRRFEAGSSVASATGSVVLLKGTPTVCTAADGERIVSASGNAALATAGSGDMLSGIVGTLLAQVGDPLAAAACGAWAHGRAAEIARDGRRSTRGITLGDAMQALAAVWEERTSVLDSGVLASLPAAGDLP